VNSIKYEYEYEFTQGLRKRTKKELSVLHISFIDSVCIPVYEVNALTMSVIFIVLHYCNDVNNNTV